MFDHIRTMLPQTEWSPLDGAETNTAPSERRILLDKKQPITQNQTFT
jgi:hypothetical protein